MAYAEMISDTTQEYDMDWKDNKTKESTSKNNVYSFTTGKLVSTGGGKRNNYNMTQYVYPIKEIEDIEKIKELIMSKSDRYHTKYRNLLMFKFGINLALRGSDLTRLKWEHLLDNRHEIREGIIVQEKKTGKLRQLKYNQSVRNAIEEYCVNMKIDKKDLDLDSYIFSTRQSDYISVDGLCKLVKGWCEEIGLGNRYGSHTLRKTFSYMYYKKTGDIAGLCKALGHAHPSITFRYIDVTDESVSKIYDEVCL